MSLRLGSFEKEEEHKQELLGGKTLKLSHQRSKRKSSLSCVPSSFQGMGTAEATLRMDNMEVKDEWQDEDFPRPLPEDGVGLTDNRSHPPTSLHVGETLAQRKRRTLVAPDMNLSLDRSEGSVLSDDFLETPDDLDINVDDIETPDETDSLEFMNNGNELEWEGQ